MTPDMDGQPRDDEWAGLAPVGDFAAWYRKAHSTPDPLTDPLPGADETAPFTPDWSDESLATARHAGTSQCGCETAGCPDGPRLPAPDDPRVLLSCGIGVTERIWHLRVLAGQWADIPKFAREAGVRVHKPAVDGLGRIHLDLEHGVLDIGAVFDQHPSLRSDPDLHAGLAQIEAGFPARLAELQRFIAERATALRAEGRAA